MPSLDLGQVVGATPNITAAATVDSSTGTPAVNVVKTGTAEQPTLTFNFSNLKGAKGDTGASGTTPTVAASASVNSSTGTPAVTVTNTGTATAANFNFAFSNLKGADGAAGVGVPSGGSADDVLVKNTSNDYDTKWTAKAPKAVTADNVGHTLSLGAIDNNGLESSAGFDGSATKRLYDFRYIDRVLAGAWSSSPNASGYYTQSLSFAIESGGATKPLSINTYYPARIRPIGSTINTLPTAAEGAAYNLVDDVWAADGESVMSITFYAKTKPTTSFYICLEAKTNDAP